MYAKQPFGVKVAQFEVDLSVAAGTHNIAQAPGLGDIEIVGVSVYCTAAGATWTSVTIHDSSAAANEIMGATKGAVENFSEDAILDLDWNFARPFHLANFNYISYTLTGSTGSGTALVTFQYRPVQKGGVLNAA
jgi:hypothetical protein